MTGMGFLGYYQYGWYLFDHTRMATSKSPTQESDFSPGWRINIWMYWSLLFFIPAKWHKGWGKNKWPQVGENSWPPGIIRRSPDFCAWSSNSKHLLRAWLLRLILIFFASGSPFKRSFDHLHTFTGEFCSKKDEINPKKVFWRHIYWVSDNPKKIYMSIS